MKIFPIKKIINMISIEIIIYKTYDILCVYYFTTFVMKYIILLQLSKIYNIRTTPQGWSIIYKKKINEMIVSLLAITSYSIETMACRDGQIR